MLTITNQSDYGILFLSSLKFEKEYVPLTALVKRTKLPRRFLARIAATLANHAIVESKEGKKGGYRLKQSARNMSLLDYLNIFEGDIEVCKCGKEGFSCKYKMLCKHGDYLKNTLTGILIKELKKITLGEVI